MAPARIEHIKLENNLKDQINEIDMQEKSLRATKDILENELINLDKKILDQQLNKEVVEDVGDDMTDTQIRELLERATQNGKDMTFEEFYAVMTKQVPA